MKLYILAYLILISLSLGAFYIFKPYSFIDNEHSKIICKNGAHYDIGPNYIFTLGNKLDAFNDRAARELCAYSVIRDYGNYYKTPPDVNYQFLPVYIKESSWGDAILVTLAAFLSGAAVIDGITYVFKKSARYRIGPKILQILDMFFN